MSSADVQKAIPSNYVGFETITSQIEGKLLKRGFQLNIMVVGKTLFILDCLFSSQFS